MFKKILVPLDGSQLAEAILPEVESLAKTFGAEVVLIRAHMPSAFQYFGQRPARRRRHRALRRSAEPRVSG